MAHSLPLRVAEIHLAELRRLIAMGRGSSMAEAIRLLIEESASRG